MSRLDVVKPPPATTLEYSHKTKTEMRIEGDELVIFEMTRSNMKVPWEDAHCTNMVRLKLGKGVRKMLSRLESVLRMRS
jgi:hypothetical protein